MKVEIISVLIFQMGPMGATLYATIILVLAVRLTQPARDPREARDLIKG